LEYRKTPEGRVEKAPERNVDTGMGLERTVMVLNGCADVYELDTLAPIVARIQALSTRTYAEAPKPFRVIADHIRAATFAISDGTRPANVGAGHVVRRLIRRAVRYGRELSIADNFCSLIAEAVIASFGPAYPELPENRTVIMDVLLDEEQKFRRTLEKGLRECTKAGAAIRTKGESVMSAKEAFHLYESSGFPLQLTAEVAREGGIEIDEAGFQALLEEHRNVSRHRLEHKFRRLAD
jgi:alanyl-tRNA synthetase